VRLGGRSETGLTSMPLSTRCPWEEATELKELRRSSRGAGELVRVWSCSRALAVATLPGDERELTTSAIVMRVLHAQCRFHLRYVAGASLKHSHNAGV
jgi:hypothetical protein